MQQNYLNPAQLELLHAMSSINTEEEWDELKLILSQFFAHLAQKEIGQL